MKKIVVILGPTASGKSALALKLAPKFRGYIISADSRQIYQGFDLGTAKPSQAERKMTPHYLFDVVKPNEDYTAALFKKDVLKVIAEKEGLPFLVGGTGLYLEAILRNLTFPAVPPDLKLRGEIEKKIAQEGLKALVTELTGLDPKAPIYVDLKNPRRVIRALEVTLKTKRPFSNYYRTGPPLFETLVLGIFPSRVILYAQIDKRVDQMIKAGLVEEVQALTKIYSKKLPAFSSLGYRQLIPHLEKKTTLPAAISEIKKETRRYAKRQLTWFKRYPEIKTVKNEAEAEKLIREFLNR